MILAFRTDKPEAELYLMQDAQTIDSLKWLAHRQLSDTLLTKVEELLQKNNCSLSDLTKIAVYQGPGSFTGLRIGITVANSLAFALNLPIVAAEGENWIEAISKLTDVAKFEGPISPSYGSEVNITKPRK